MGLKLRKRNRYKKVPIAYQYMPWDDPDPDIPATYDDNERHSYMGTNIMFPVGVSAEVPKYQENPYIQNPVSISNGIDYRDYDEKYQPREMTGDLAFAMKSPHEKGLETVSPEFDLLTLGMVGKDLWKGWRALKAMPKSYTGVPQPYADNFPNWNGKIWTTDDLQMAKEYAKGGFGKWNNLFGEGTVYKIYGKDLDKGLYTKVIPEPPKGYAYLKERVPYKLSTNGENGSVKQLAKVEDADLMPNGVIIEDHGVINVPNAKGAVIPTGQYESIDVMASNANMKNTRTNVLVIPRVVDNSYKVGGKYITPAMTERVYIPHIGAAIIRAPLNELEFMTALKNTTNFGGTTAFGTGLTRYGFNNND